MKIAKSPASLIVGVGGLLVVLGSTSLSRAQGLTPGGTRFVNQLIQVSQGDASFPPFILIQGPRILGMSLDATNRIPRSQVPAVINRINAMGAQPPGVGHELAVEYYLIVEILLDYFGFPQYAQEFVDGIWDVSPASMQWAEQVLASLRAFEQLPPVPPGGGLFSTDPVLLCTNLNLGRALGGVPTHPCF